MMMRHAAYAAIFAARFFCPSRYTCTRGYVTKAMVLHLTGERPFGVDTLRHATTSPMTMMSARHLVCAWSLEGGPVGRCHRCFRVKGFCWMEGRR